MMGLAGPVPENSEVDEAVASALRALRAPVQGYVLPYQLGMAGIVLGFRPMFGAPLWRPIRPTLVPEPAIGSGGSPVIAVVEPVEKKVSRASSSGDAASSVAKRRRIEDTAIPASFDVTTSQAMRWWRGILAEMGDSAELYIQMQECDNDRLADRSFVAAFFGKPASTLQKRAGSIRLYIRWAHSVRLPPFPIKESTIFRYMEDLHSEGAPASRAQTFKEALNFSVGMVGLRGVREALSSRRVLGSALASFSRKAEVRKRHPLTKDELVALERFLDSNSDDNTLRDRTVAGFILFCVYCRLRVGDAARIVREPTLDVNRDTGEGYINAGMIEHKTSYRVQNGLSLPVSGAAIGVSGLRWASSWLGLRAHQGLSASSLSPLMPSPAIDNTWDRHRRLETSECTIWLREILIRISGLTSERAGGVGSHSLKATLLSWSAKFGLSAATRRRLGGHVKPKDRSLKEYSRDELAGPMLELDRVLRSVALGVFDPDSSRSGRWKRDEDAEAKLSELFPAAVTPVLPDSGSSAVTPVDPDSGSSDESSSSPSEIQDTESGSEGGRPPISTGAEEFGLRSRTTPRPEGNADLPPLPFAGLIRNRVSGILHGAIPDEVRMVCGRMYPDECHHLTFWPVCPYPRCRGCFKSDPSTPSNK